MKGKAKSKRYASGGKVSAFGQAFRDARAGKQKEFSFNGKKYTTDTAEENYSKLLSASTKANQAVGSPTPPKPTTPVAKALASPAAKTPAAPAAKAAAPKSFRDAMKQTNAAEAARFKREDDARDAKFKAQREARATAKAAAPKSFREAVKQTDAKAEARTAARDKSGPSLSKIFAYKKGGKVKKRFI